MACRLSFYKIILFLSTATVSLVVRALATWDSSLSQVSMARWLPFIFNSMSLLHIIIYGHQSCPYNSIVILRGVFIRDSTALLLCQRTSFVLVQAAVCAVLNRLLLLGSISLIPCSIGETPMSCTVQSPWLIPRESINWQPSWHLPALPGRLRPRVQHLHGSTDLSRWRAERWASLVQVHRLVWNSVVSAGRWGRPAHTIQILLWLVRPLVLLSSHRFDFGSLVLVKAILVMPGVSQRVASLDIAVLAPTPSTISVAVTVALLWAVTISTVSIWSPAWRRVTLGCFYYEEL